MCSVNIACDLEDVAFMFVDAVVRDNAPVFRHCNVCK